MNRARCLAVSLATLLCACRAAPIEVEAEDTRAEARVPAPHHLGELVEQYRDLTGYSLTFDASTADALAAIPVTPVGPEGVDVLLIGAPEGDASKAMSFDLVPLEFAEARALAATIDGLLAHASEGGVRRARVHADERSNALLVYAPNGQRDAVLDLVAKLDVEVR